MISRKRAFWLQLQNDARSRPGLVAGAAFVAIGGLAVGAVWAQDKPQNDNDKDKDKGISVTVKGPENDAGLVDSEGPARKR